MTYLWQQLFESWAKINEPKDENQYITIDLPDGKEIRLCFKPTEDEKWQCTMEDETMQDIQNLLNSED